MSVYRVTDLIGTSPNSWEDAAQEALAAARASLRDMRIAEVIEQDIVLDKLGNLVSFRTKLRVSFKYEYIEGRTNNFPPEPITTM